MHMHLLQIAGGPNRRGKQVRDELSKIFKTLTTQSFDY